MSRVRTRRRRGVARAAALLPAVLPGTVAAADRPPAPAEPPAEAPALGLDTWAAHRAAALRAEHQALAERAAAATAARQPVLRGRAALRGLAATLLDAGDRAGPRGSAAILAGVRLAEARGAIDEALAAAADGTAAHLERFSEAVPPAPGDLVETAALDAWLASAVAPLAEALGVRDGAEAHWIRRDDVGGGTSPEALLEKVAARVDAAPLDEAARQHLLRVVELLRRGAAFDAFRPQVERFAGLLAAVPGLAAALDRASWLGAGVTAPLRDRLTGAAALLAERPTREQGAARLRRLIAAGELLDAATRLRDAARAASQSFPGRSRPRTDDDALGARLAPLGAAALALTDFAEDAGRADALLEAAEGMISRRGLAGPRLSGELRVLWRRTAEAYRSAEEAVLAQAVPLVAPGALAQPALASLLADHARHLEDLRRLAALPGLLERAERHVPRAATPLGGALRRAAVRLGDPDRRAEARAAFDELSRQIELFLPLPFESELRRGDPAAVAATGGFHAELVAAADAAREHWAIAWGRAAAPAGDAGLEAAEASLRALHDLGDAMARAAALGPADDPLSLLNRWAAWELDAATVERLRAELHGRLKLATTAAVEGRSEALRAQLERLHLRPLDLAARLVAVAGGALRALPDGAAGAVGQCLGTPPPDAWLAADRGALADLCRYTMELCYRGDAAGAGLRDYVDNLARSLDPEPAP